MNKRCRPFAMNIFLTLLHPFPVSMVTVVWGEVKDFHSGRFSQTVFYTLFAMGVLRTLDNVTYLIFCAGSYSVQSYDKHPEIYVPAPPLSVLRSEFFNERELNICSQNQHGIRFGASVRSNNISTVLFLYAHEESV